MGISSGKTYTLDEWLKEGIGLFGRDRRKWQFVCPSCKRTQSVRSLEQYADQGATPEDVYRHCIGRFSGGLKGPHKCDWAAYGLSRGPDFVIDEDGDELPVFQFYRERKGSKHED